MAARTDEEGTAGDSPAPDAGAGTRPSGSGISTRWRWATPRTWRSARPSGVSSARNPSASTAARSGSTSRPLSHAVADGRFAEALAIIKADNTLPAICGRVCPAGRPVRGDLRHRQQGRAGGDRASRAIRRRPREREQGRSDDAAVRRIVGLQGRHRRLRSRGSRLRGDARPEGAQGHGLRGPPQTRVVC